MNKKTGIEMLLTLLSDPIVASHISIVQYNSKRKSEKEKTAGFSEENFLL